MTLKFENLYKSYGNTEILHGINFTVYPGKPMAFLGRNGAGKTTTIRGFMDVFRFDKGSITLEGKNFNARDYKIGYLPEERGLYQKHKILDQLIYLSKLEVLSKGNQQKVQIVQALMNNPEIVILDEPFSGLDPVNSKILRDLVKEISTKGNYLIFSSHQMGYVEEMCDDLTIIHKGDIVVSDTISNIKKEIGAGRISISAENMTLDELELYLRTQIPQIKFERLNENLIVSIDNMEKSSFIQNLLDIGVEIEKFSNYEPSVYDIFLKTVGGSNE